MKAFKNYKWQSKETLESFMECTSFLVRFKSQYTPIRQHKMIQELKHLFVTKYEQIMPILEQLSINKMPQLLSIIYVFEKSKQLQAKYEIEIPSKLINKGKKQIVDSIRMQKELINKYTIGNITMSMALIDYCKTLSSEVQQNKENELPVLHQSIALSLFPFRPIPFNSINYFTYHELTKLVNSEIPHLPVKTIAQTLFAASFVRYKNQGIFEDIMSRTIQKIHYESKESGKSLPQINLKYNKEFIMFACSFHHCRMVNKNFYHFMECIKENGVSAMVSIEPNLLLRFFETVASLSFTTDSKYEEDFRLTKYFTKVFEVCYEQNFKNSLSALKKQELLVLQYICQLFEFFKIKLEENLSEKTKKHNITEVYFKKISQIETHLSKFQSKFTIQDQYLQSMTKLLKKMNDILLVQDQNQIQVQTLIDQHFISAESNFYKFSINTIMDQQQQIGSQFRYQYIYENVRKKLKSEYPDANIVPKTWRIQNCSEKQVFFLTTYEHLYAKYQDENTSVRLFGFWKVYYELYNLANWKFRFICTFLEG